MDLSFAPFDHDAELHVLPGDLAALMVGVLQRQAASPTAAAQARWAVAADPLLFQPLDGAFNGPMAMAMLRWRKNEEGVHQGVSADLQAGRIFRPVSKEGAASSEGLI